MHTEQEAKDLWCPMFRLTPSHDEKYDVHDNRSCVHPAIYCLGSKCAAWRWADLRYVDDEPGDTQTVKTGYCGLAGPC